mgnify:CR=1 FL=1
MKIYKNCRELPIHNFFELSRTGEVKYLYKDYDDVVNLEENEEINQVRIDVIDEYNSLFKDKQNLGILTKAEILSLEIYLQNLFILQDLILVSGDSDDVKSLAISMNVDIDSLEIYIKTTKSQLNKINNQQEKESEDSENDVDSLEKTLSLVKENGFNFDRYSTPIIEFVFAINRLEEKSEQQKTLNKR